MIGLTLYETIKFFHILLAIIAIGFNASYGIWLTRAAREPEHELHVLKGIKVLDDRFANPAYVLLLVTGLLNVWVGNWPITTFWIATALGLYLVLVIGGLLYTPTLRKQIEVLQTQGRESAEYQRLSDKGARLGIFLAVIVVAIVFLMVTKPTL